MGIEGLQYQLVDVKFTGGMDTKTNKKLVIPGKWNLLQNCGLTSDYTLTKRTGHTALLATNNGNGLATYNSELLTYSGTAMTRVLRTSNPAATSAVPGQLPLISVAKSEVSSTNGYQFSPDCASSGVMNAYVWIERTAAFATVGVRAAIYDSKTGSNVYAAATLRSGNISGCRVVANNNGDFFFFYYDPSGTPGLYCRVFRSGFLTMGAEVKLISSASFNGKFDACLFSAATIGVGYRWGDGTTSVRAITVKDTAGVPSIDIGPVNMCTEANLNNAGITGLGVYMLNGTSGQAATLGQFVIATQSVAASGIYSGLSVFFTDSSLVPDAAAAPNISAVTTPTNAAVSVCMIGANQFVFGGSGNAFSIFVDQVSEASTNGVVPIRRIDVLHNYGFNPGVTRAVNIANSACFTGATAVGAGPKGPFICGKPFASYSVLNSNGSGTTWYGYPYTTGLVTAGQVFLPVYVFENYQLASANVNTLNQQNTVFIMDGYTGVIVGKALYGTLSPGAPSSSGVGPTLQTCGTPSAAGTTANGAGPFLLAVPEAKQVSFSADTVAGTFINQTYSGICSLSLFANQLQETSVFAPQKAQVGQATYIANGSLSAYDSQQVVEHGFPLFPEGISCVAGGAGTGSVRDGTYQVVAVYEWIDGAGQRHQSAPCLPLSETVATGANTGSLAIGVPSLLISQKPNVQIGIYATQPGGLTFNRVTTLQNSTAAATVTVNITNPNADWASSELLYTQPNQSGTTLANDAPGPCKALAVHQNRLFVDVSDKPGYFRYSQQLVDGVGLQFNEALQGVVPVDAGGITGFASLDEQLFIFCARRIYRILGTGPASSGAYNNYSDPVEVPSDVGCVEPNSILKTNFGVIFKSPKGFYLLGRDLTVKYIGEGVANLDFQTITSAVMMVDRQECRFSSTAGTQLVYHYAVNEWSTSKYTSKTNGQSTYKILDAAWWDRTGDNFYFGGRWVTVSVLDGVNIDSGVNDAVGLNSAYRVSMLARTAFFHLGKMEGFQRVKNLYLTCSSSVAPTSQFTFLVDFDDVYQVNNPPGANNAYSLTVDLSAITFPTVANIDLNHKLRQQKCKSVAFTFQDAPVNAGDVGITGMQALALQIGMKRGTYKLPAAQSVG